MMLTTYFNQYNMFRFPGHSSRKLSYAKRLLFALVIITFGLASFSCNNGPSQDESNHNQVAEYSIIYSGNGQTAGTAPEDHNFYKSNRKVTLLDQGSLVKDGYIFNGWNSADNGSGTSYPANGTYTITKSNAQLYAQWLNQIAYNEFINSNVSVIDILNVSPLPENNWYYATVDIVNGSLTLKDGKSSAKFQFQYKTDNDRNSTNQGYLRISNNPSFRTASSAGKVRAMETGDAIGADIFSEYEVAEISGSIHNWDDMANIFIPAFLTLDNEVHFGYLKVSFKDDIGQLTIHATAYNRIAGKRIIAGSTGN